MKYMCLVYQDESKLASMPDSELEKIVSECMAYVDELGKSGHHVMSAALQSTRTATSLRKGGTGVTMTDGPFAETKEVLGGFTILEARDLNEALHLASKFPNAGVCTIEVRPVMELGAEVCDPLDRKLMDAVRRAVESAPSSGS